MTSIYHPKLSRINPNPLWIHDAEQLEAVAVGHAGDVVADGPRQAVVRDEAPEVARHPVGLATELPEQVGQPDSDFGRRLRQHRMKVEVVEQEVFEIGQLPIVLRR